MQNENWKEIPGLPGYYQVSDKGRVATLKHGFRIYRPEIEQKTPKPARKAAEIAQPAKKRGRPAKKAISKPVKTRKKKNG